MAYDLGSRFSSSSKFCMLLEPCAYQRDRSHTKNNKTPFLSRTARISSPGGQLWTHALYNPRTSFKIINCTSLKSKCPRFPYESLNKKDLEDLLCRCGTENKCACPTDEVVIKDIVCQAKVRKRLFIGPTPKPVLDERLSAFNDINQGFKIYTNRSKNMGKGYPRPLYITTRFESTAFYHGCKWSKRTSKRFMTSIQSSPGPADYNNVKIPSDYEICIEKLRAYKRQTAKQLRFMERVHQKNILESLPGPATYYPQMPKCYESEFTGPRAARFALSKREQCPGPADHLLKRAFDPPEAPTIPCHFQLRVPSPFGTKAIRLKPKKEEGPSPATYNPNFRGCLFVQCPMAAFGSSSVRFRESPIDKCNDGEVTVNENLLKGKDNQKQCVSPTWQFRSNTLRIKPLVKNTKSTSPADMPQHIIKVIRPHQLQIRAPFSSSEGRFEPWNNWMSVYGKYKTPGPGYYALEKPKRHSAVARGPLYRSPRFQHIKNTNPSPNTYNISGGLETVLATHNQRLKGRIKSKYTSTWKPVMEPVRLTFEEREKILLQKSIALLDTTMTPEENDEEYSSNARRHRSNLDEIRSILLRCSLDRQKMPHEF